MFKRCIVWFYIPAHANRKFPFQLGVKIQILFEPPFWICKWANHLSFLAMIASNHGWFCSWIFINQIASCMTSANKRWTIFGRRSVMKTRIYFFKIIFHHSFDHIDNFIIICDRIKINCHMFIRNPMMGVKNRKYI